MKESIARTYDRESVIYDETRYIKNKYRYYTACVAEKIVLRFLREGRILELGVGTGRFAQPFSERHEYVGIDISRGMLSVAKEKLRDKVELILMDAESLGFKDESFDNIICIHTFKFFPNPMKVLNESYRILKNKGRLIIMTESKDRFFQSFTFKRCHSDIRKLYKMNRLGNLLKCAGFDILFCKKIFVYPITFYKIIPKQMFKFMWKFDNSKYEVFGNEVFIVGEKNDKKDSC